MNDTRTSDRKVFEEPFAPEAIRRPRPGQCYLIREPKPALMFRIIQNVKGPALLISRTPTENYPQEVDGSVTSIWLSGLPGEEHVKGEDLGQLMKVTKDFLHENGHGGVYLEGLEYLTIRNSFTMMIELLRSMSRWIHASDSFLMVSLYPDAFENEEMDQLDDIFDEVLL